MEKDIAAVDIYITILQYTENTFDLNYYIEYNSCHELLAISSK